VTATGAEAIDFVQQIPERRGLTDLLERQSRLPSPIGRAGGAGGILTAFFLPKIFQVD